MATNTNSFAAKSASTNSASTASPMTTVATGNHRQSPEVLPTAQVFGSITGRQRSGGDIEISEALERRNLDQDERSRVDNNATLIAGSEQPLAETAEHSNEDRETMQMRNHTAPSTATHVDETKTVTNYVSGAREHNSGNTTAPTIKDTAGAQSSLARSRKRTASSDEVDEEIRIAQAMAMAMKANPHLSPEEIRNLVGAPKSIVGTSITSQQPITAAGQRLSTFFQNATTALSSDTNNPLASFATSSTITATATSSNAASENDKRKSVRAGFRNFTDSLIKQAGRSNLVNLSSSNTASSLGGAGNFNSDFRAAGGSAINTTKPAMGLGNIGADTSNKTSPKTVTSATSAAPVDMLLNNADVKAVPAASSSNASKESKRATPTQTAPASTAFNNSLAALQQHLPNMPNGITAAVKPFGVDLTSPMFQNAFAAAPSVDKAAYDQRMINSKHSTAGMQQKNHHIRLSGIAWKRRGGMGKYMSTSAWERRRVELVGTRLLYYLQEGEILEGNGGDSPTSKFEDLPLAASSYVDDASGGRSGTSEESATRRSSWFEQAAANLVNVAAISNLSSNPTQPRGCLDLSKEKATVHAAFGHSGAPSPFALSIKVRGETKWKLCFDHHKSQMEWLAAISDVVVQGSVDAYNANLLAAVDPANIANEFFHPPYQHNEPPAMIRGDTTHRLWMMEHYTLESATGLSVIEDSDGSDDDDTGFDAASQIDEPADPDIVKTEVCVQTMKTFSSPQGDDSNEVRERVQQQVELRRVIPEHHLLFVAAIVNLSLAITRASSISIDNFWLLVVLINFAMYFFTRKEPDWRSVLEYARSIVKADDQVPSNPPTSLVQVKTTTMSGLSTKKVKSLPLITTPTRLDYIPKAGCSTVKLRNATDAPVNSKNEVFAGWRTIPGTIMTVRSHGYLTTKKKVPSPGCLYECVNVDIFESPNRYPDMATRVKLPDCNFNDANEIKTWRTPDIFIVSIGLPTDSPKLGRSTSDGGGYTVTLYFRMLQETRDILRRITADGYDPLQENVDDPQLSKVNAVKLLEEWCRRAPTDPKFQARFKVVPNAHNLSEIGVPSWISKYNGKPFLIKRAGETGFLYSHPELSCMEFDISLHPFPYLAKQGLCFMKENYFKKILVSFGFVIEGRADDELPECLIGLMQLCYPDPTHAIQAEAFFGGLAPKSF